MDKAGLLQQLASTFHKVLTPEEVRNDEGIKIYKVRVIDKIDADSMSDRVINFRVEDEGEVDEAAYWVGAAPVAQEATTFRNEVQARLDTAIQNGQVNIKAGWITKVDEENEKADIEVMRGDPDVTQQFAIVYRDGATLNFEWYTK